jgi:ubiquinone/menaquinone biosynthesis C-methylase UbiE
MSTAEFSAARFKREDAVSYDCHAEAFDRFERRCSASLAARMVALARLEGDHRVLDVGTGTGLVALESATRLGENGSVLGVDLSEGMLAVARARAVRAASGPRIEFRSMDAEALELDGDSFDAVLSLFALFHFPNPLAALGEMRRVLRPGGRLVVGVGVGPPLSSWQGLRHRIGRLPDIWRRMRGLQLTAPAFLNGLVEKHLPEGANREIPDWVQERRDKRRWVRSLIREAGFVNLRCFWEGHDLLLESAEEFWDLQMTFSTMARKRLAHASEEKVEIVRRQFMQTCARVQARGGRLAYPSAAFFVAAERPASEARQSSRGPSAP